MIIINNNLRILSIVNVNNNYSHIDNYYQYQLESNNDNLLV